MFQNFPWQRIEWTIFAPLSPMSLTRCVRLLFIWLRSVDKSLFPLSTFCQLSIVPREALYVQYKPGVLTKWIWGFIKQSLPISMIDSMFKRFLFCLFFMYQFPIFIVFFVSREILSLISSNKKNVPCMQSISIIIKIKRNCYKYLDMNMLKIKNRGGWNKMNVKWEEDKGRISRVVLEKIYWFL